MKILSKSLASCQFGNSFYIFMPSFGSGSKRNVLFTFLKLLAMVSLYVYRVNHLKKTSKKVVKYNYSAPVNYYVQAGTHLMKELIM